jgi:hypothetical protein
LLVKAEQTVARRARLAQAVVAALCALAALLLLASAAGAEQPASALLGTVTTTTTHVLAPVTGDSQSATAESAPASAAPSAPAPEPVATPATTVAQAVDHVVAPSSAAPTGGSPTPTSAGTLQATTRATAPTPPPAHVLSTPRGAATQLGDRAGAIARRPEQVATPTAATRIAALGAGAGGSQRKAIAPADRPAARVAVRVRTLIGDLAHGDAATGLAATLAGATARLEGSLAGTLARLETLTPTASLAQPVLAATLTPPWPGGDFGSLGGSSPAASIGSSANAQPGTSPRADALAKASAATAETPIEASGSARTSGLVTDERGAAITAGGTHASAPGEPLAARTRSIVATAATAVTPRTAFADSRARGVSPASPAPAGGLGAGASASGGAGGLGLSLTLALAALLLALAPGALRRLRLAAARWRIAPLRLIPARPG